MTRSTGWPNFAFDRNADKTCCLCQHRIPNGQEVRIKMKVGKHGDHTLYAFLPAHPDCASESE